MAAAEAGRREWENDPGEYKTWAAEQGIDWAVKKLLGRAIGGVVADWVTPDPAGTPAEDVFMKALQEEYSSRLDRCFQCGACADNGPDACPTGTLN